MCGANLLISGTALGQGGRNHNPRALPLSITVEVHQLCRAEGWLGGYCNPTPPPLSNANRH